MADQVTYGDIERAVEDRDPQLGDLLVRYLAQDDPLPGRPEAGDPVGTVGADGAAPDADGAGTDDAGEDDAPEPPAGAMTLARLRHAVSPQALRGRTATERKLARRDAWQAALASPWTPPRLRLGQLLVELYERDDEHGRAALVRVFTDGRLGWGSWQAAKTIYKRAEERHDALLFGALAHRFDVMHDTGQHHRDEIGAGTVLYLKRRAWRWLRHLGQAVPDAYPVFAAEVLRHYGPRPGYRRAWIARYIWGRRRLRGAKRPVPFEPAPLDDRAFAATWKLSPAPLVRLLLDAGNELVCGWAARSLEAEHGPALHALPPATLASLGRRPLAAVQELVVRLLRARAELHATRYREVGLHEVVVGWLRSPSAAAAAFAIEYARGQGASLTVDELVALVTASPHADVIAFAVDRLGALATAELGLPALVRLVGHGASRALAIARLKEGARPTDLDAALFVTLAAGTAEQRRFVVEWFTGAGAVIPAGHWIAALADPRCDWQLRRQALDELGRRSGEELGARWLQEALEDPALTAHVAGWLRAGKLAGPALDVAWVKGLVARPRLRALALELLARRDLVAPSSIGLTWLLELARSGEPELHGFAHRLLLEHFTPEDFADGHRAAGLARLWELASGPRVAEPVRAFASTYLRAHHPELGPTLAEARALGVTPRLGPGDYPAPRVRPLLDDARADVRRLACAIAGEEVVRWGDRGLPYELAASGFREPRALGNELLLGAARGDGKLPADWLDGARLFALAESPHKGTREAALTIIRRAYERVGGRERLAWLMESAERDVRLFAVRLFWDRHRPRATPPGWTPPRAVGVVTVADPLPTGDAEVVALRQFVRTVLFGLPPGRLEKRDAVAGAEPERPLASSVAKRRLIEAMRELGRDDAGFAAMVAPVLGELAASVARGEWQAAVAALAALRQAHPGLGSLGLPAARERPARTPPRSP